MKITKQWLDNNNACDDAIAWYLKQKETNFFKLVKEAKKIKKYGWINFAVARKLKKMDRIKYAIYAAKQVLYIFEKKYPEDKRPRNAIDAAKKYLKNPNTKSKNPNTKSKNAAANAAANAAYAAYASANAADVYANAADVYAAAYAAYASAYAASAAYASAAYASADAKNKLYNKIINYGLKILKSHKKEEK